MRVVYNDGEKEQLKDIYEKYTSLKLFDDDNPDKLYSITFKVTNPSLAQFIFTSLLYDRSEDFDLGINVTEINFNRIQDKDEIRQKIHQMIDNILDGEQ